MITIDNTNSPTLRPIGTEFWTEWSCINYNSSSPLELIRIKYKVTEHMNVSPYGTNFTCLAEKLEPIDIEKKPYERIYTSSPEKLLGRSY